MVEQESRPHISTYMQVEVLYSYYSEVLNSSFLNLMIFSAKNPHLREAANS